MAVSQEFVCWRRYKQREKMKILAVGMNYDAHNKEMRNTLIDNKEPVIFMKPDSSLFQNTKPMFLPDDLGRIDYETEIVIRICRMGKSIAPRFAHRYYDAVTVGIDFTARDLQAKCKEQGLPWTICKGFDGATALGDWVPVDEVGDVQNVNFHLDINGKTVQQGNTSDMIHKVDELIAYISQFITLKTGDVLFTGTPVGVGPVKIGDHLEGYLEDRKLLEFNIK